MSETSEPARRRRRRRASASQGPARPRPADVEPAPQQPNRPAPGAGPKRARQAQASPVEARGVPSSGAGDGPSGGKRRRVPRDHPGDRGLRDLVGAGRSAVGVDGALRARDVNRPSEDELDAAERDLVIVRRHWRPPPDERR